MLAICEKTMNDMTDTPKNKPTVFYAQKKETDKRSSEKKKTGNKFPSQNRDKQARHSHNSEGEPYKGRSSRIESFQPRKAREERRDVETDNSPWQASIRKREQQPTFDHSKRVDVPTIVQDEIDSDQLRQQRQEETIVYSENSCQAIFRRRPDSIIKAFLVQEMTVKFRSLVRWLAENRRGYDVITPEQMARISGTSHHGGVCFIVKKRQPIMAADYLMQNAKAKSDCVLAIDDVNNPHNLGGLIRSAAFFDVNGVILRNMNAFDVGSALRVAEGGAEYVNPIKADDLVVTLDLFKQQGYQITALLPCKMKEIAAQPLRKAELNKKVVFILCQQVNPTLLKCADSIVYLPGNSAMASLNISVATGILLSTWQQVGN